MYAQLQFAAGPVFLVSFYKPLLLLATFVPWAWLISSKLEKDARSLKLKYRQFNLIYMACAAAALGAWLAVPVFWIGWPLGIVVLLAPVYAYVQVRNRAVPEKRRFELGGLFARKLHSAKQVRGVKAAVHFVDPEGNEHKNPPKGDPRLELHMALEDVIVPALEMRASQVDISVGPGGITWSHTRPTTARRMCFASPNPHRHRPTTLVRDAIASLNGTSISWRWLGIPTSITGIIRRCVRSTDPTKWARPVLSVCPPRRIRGARQIARTSSISLSTC